MPGSIVVGSNMFISRWYIAPDRREKFLHLFNAMWQADLPGLQQATHFVFFGWGRNPDELVAIESWKDEAAVTALRESDAFNAAVAELMSCCNRPMTMEVYCGLQAPRDVFAVYPAGPSKVHPTSGAIGAVFI